MKRYKKIIAILLSLALIISTFGIFEVSAATDDKRYSNKHLENGGFEDNENRYKWSGGYTQPTKTNVPYWDTTAYGSSGKNGMFEFFKGKSDGNTNHFKYTQTNYPNQPNLYEVAQGNIAAELNADEVSTIYQRIKTVSGSTYTWGLDHRGREATDRMVLIIGPEQSVDPSKPSKAGDDQFVRITNWLKVQYNITYPETGCSKKYTVYSKPFAASGKFENESANEDENISMAKTDEINQEWNIWVISSLYCNTSTVDGEAVNGWTKYGTNRYDENDDSYNDVIKGDASPLGYDCTYTVPKGQTNTIFAFCSYSSYSVTAPSKSATFGNLLDDISFKLYQPISSSITPGGTGGVEGGKVTVSGDVESDKLFADVTEDGNVCKIYTAKSSADDKYKFVGAYITETANDGSESTRYVSICHHNLTGLTKEEIEAEHASVGFVPYKHDENVTDDAKWDYYFILKVNNPVHIHMIYTKAPYVIYDANGGLPYKYGPNNESGNDSVAFGDGYYTGGPKTESYYKNSYYKFDENNHDITIKEKGYYYSHTAYDNPNWKKNSFNVGAKFVGWSVLGKDNNMHTFDAKHKIEYMPIDAAGGSITIFDVDENGNPKENANAIELALNENDGATLTAQWKFGYTAQAQTLTGHSLEEEKQEYINSAVGGTVSETFIDNRSDVEDHKDAEGRVERTDAYGSVGSKIIFRATPDTANNYVFDGWYTKETDGTYKLVTTDPKLAITVEQGNSEAYYARFKTKTVPVIFYYSASGNPADYDYYDKNTNNKYGKHFQEVVYNEKAVPPKDDSMKVTMWFTSPTERDQEHLFNFSTPITEKTKLYASPAFTFNYFNFFKGKEPWFVDVYATLKFNGKYIDMKNDADMTNYNIYMLKGTLDEATPSASDIKSNKSTKKVSKGSSEIKFNQTTNTGQTFNRAGTKYSDFYIFNMKTPVWVLFDFTYKGITYTSAIKDRSLYNDITVYMQTEKSQLFTTYPEKTELINAQNTLLTSIQDMYTAVSKYTGIKDPTPYNDGTSVSGLPEGETSSTYTFSSTTAIRNIEPWGLKYTFSVNGQTITDFADYGAVVLTDKSGTYTETPSISQILTDSNSLLYSKANNNIYYADDGSVEIYHINDLLATDFSKNTYTVFFVKDDSGYHYSNVVTNSYNELANAETSDEIQKEINQSITKYSQALIDYYNIKNRVGITT